MSVISTIIFNNISLQLEQQNEFLDKILVVYNLFDKELLKDIFQDLGFKKDLSNLHFISINEFKKYSYDKEFKYAITFEDLSSFKIKRDILTLNFPVSRADKIKLIKLLNK